MNQEKLKNLILNSSSAQSNVIGPGPVTDDYDESDDEGPLAVDQWEVEEDEEQEQEIDKEGYDPSLGPRLKERINKVTENDTELPRKLENLGNNTAMLTEYYREAIADVKKMLGKKSSSLLTSSENEVFRMFLIFWEEQVRKARVRFARDCALRRHDILVDFAINNLGHAMKEHSVESFLTVARRYDHKINNDKGAFTVVSRLRPDIMILRRAEEQIVCIEVKGGGDITDALRTGEKYQGIKTAFETIGYSYKYILLHASYLNTWRDILHPYGGQAIYSDYDHRLLNQFDIEDRTLRVMKELYEEVRESSMKKEEEESRIKPVTIKLSNVARIRGFNDAWSSRWVQRVNTIEQVADEMREALIVMEDPFKETSINEIEGAFKNVRLKNDECEVLDYKKAKPISMFQIPMGNNSPLDEKLSMIRYFKSLKSRKDLRGTAGGFVNFINQRKMVDGVEVDALEDNKNSIKVSANRASKESDMVDKIYTLSKTIRTARPLRTLRSEIFNICYDDIDSVRTALEGETNAGITLEKYKELVNSPVGSYEDEVREVGDRIMESLLKTRAARLLKTASDTSESILLNLARGNKFFTVYDGGSKDQMLLIMPHGLSNNSSTVVKFVTVCRKPLVRCFDRVFDSFTIDGEEFEVSNIVSLERQRLIMYRNAFNSVIHYSISQAINYNGSEEEKLAYAKKCMSFGALMALCPNQDVSLISDLFKYMLNAGLSEFSNVRSLIEDKASIKVKNKLSAFLLINTEDWMKKLVKSRDSAVGVDIVVVDGEIDSSDTGILGEWPSMVANGTVFNDFKMLIQEINGLNILRGKGLYGDQKMADEYVEIRDTDIKYDDDLREIGQDKMNDARFIDLVKPKLGQLGRSYVELGTQLYYKDKKRLESDILATLNTKNLDKSIITISSMNGTVIENGADGKNSSTSISDALNIINKFYKEGGAKCTIINLLEYASDGANIIKLSKKLQRGGVRGITSVTMKIKILYRVIEMIEQSTGDHIDSNIITGTRHKLETIKKMWESVSRQSNNSDSRLGTSLWHASEDNQKWSNSMESSVFLYMARNAPIYRKNSAFMRAAECAIGKNYGRELLISHNIGKPPNNDNRAWSEVYNLKTRGKKMKVFTGWPQGMFNNWSTNLKTVANDLANRIAKIIIRNDLTILGVEHSDDSWYCVKMTKEEIKTYIKIRKLVWLAFGMKPSTKKCSIGRLQGEVISNHIINGEVVNPYIKDVIGVSNAYSCKGPGEDFIDGLSRLRGLIRSGASIEECLQHRRLIYAKIQGLYSCKTGQKNDPTSIVQRLTGVSIPQHIIPMTLFGRPGISMMELIGCGPSADDLVKAKYIINTSKGNISKENETESTILETMLIFSLNIAAIGNDNLNITSRIMGSLKYNMAVNISEKNVDSFKKRLLHVKAKQSFPLFTPSRSNLAMLEYLKDLSLSDSYKAALSNTSEDIACRRKLAMMVVGKSLRYFILDDEELRAEEILLNAKSTDKSQVRNNEVRSNTYRLGDILSDVMTGKWRENARLKEVKYKTIGDAEALIGEFKVYNSLLAIIQSYRLTNFKDKKKPSRGINRVDKLTVAIADARTVTKCLTEIFRSKIREEEFGTMSGEEIVIKNYIMNRFGKMVANSEGDVSIANRISKILKDESMKSTPYLQPYVRAKNYIDFLHSLFENITYSQNTVRIISDSYFKRETNILTSMDAVTADVQIQLTSKLNKWHLNKNAVKDVSVADLQNYVLRSSEKFKKTAAIYEMLNYDTQSIMNDLYESKDRISHEYYNKKRRFKEGKYYGKMDMIIQRGQTKCRVTRVDNEDRENSGLLSVSVNTTRINDIIKLVRYYLQVIFGRNQGSNAYTLNHEGLIRAKGSGYGRKKMYIKEWEVNHFTYLTDPSIGELACLQVELDYGIPSVKSYKENYISWTINHDKMRVESSDDNGWLVPKIEKGKEYQGYIVTCNVGHEEVTFDNSNDICALVDEEPGDISSLKIEEIYALLSPDDRLYWLNKVVKMVGGKIERINLGADRPQRIYKLMTRLYRAGYVKYDNVVINMIAGRYKKTINFDSFCMGLQNARTKPGFPGMREHWNNVLADDRGFSIICAIAIGKIVSSLYNIDIRNDEVFLIPTAGSEGIIRGNKYVSSSIEYKAGMGKYVSNELDVDTIRNLFEVESASTTKAIDLSSYASAIANGTKIDWNESDSDDDDDYLANAND